MEFKKFSLRNEICDAPKSVNYLCDSRYTDYEKILEFLKLIFITFSEDINTEYFINSENIKNFFSKPLDYKVEVLKFIEKFKNLQLCNPITRLNGYINYFLILFRNDYSYVHYSFTGEIVSSNDLLKNDKKGFMEKIDNIESDDLIECSKLYKYGYLEKSYMFSEIEEVNLDKCERYEILSDDLKKVKKFFYNGYEILEDNLYSCFLLKNYYCLEYIVNHLNFNYFSKESVNEMLKNLEWNFNLVSDEKNTLKEIILKPI